MHFPDLDDYDGSFTVVAPTCSCGRPDCREPEDEDDPDERTELRSLYAHQDTNEPSEEG